MTQELPEQELPIPDRLPQRVSEGMAVYDRDGELVGTVDVVYLGGASEEAIERVLHLEEAPPAREDEQDHWSIFDSDNVPPESRAKFMRQGFLVVTGSDLTGVKRYFGPEQIEGVFTQDVEGSARDVVRLYVSRDEWLSG